MITGAGQRYEQQAPFALQVMRVGDRVLGSIGQR